MSPAAPEAIVLGASAGALEALTKLLPTLPADYRLPILVVVHLPSNGRSLMAKLLQAKSRIVVAEAEDKEPIRSGCVYLAPPDYHLLVETDRTIALSSDEQVHFSRPSIDVLFESAADVYGAALTGIVLTGANSDGALGLKSIVAAGGTALVQDPATAYTSAMPQAAIAACPNARVLSLAGIAAYLQEVGQS